MKLFSEITCISYAPDCLADFYDPSQFEMINFANVYYYIYNHYNSDPVISLFGNMQIVFSIYGI